MVFGYGGWLCGRHWKLGQNLCNLDFWLWVYVSSFIFYFVLVVYKYWSCSNVQLLYLSLQLLIILFSNNHCTVYFCIHKIWTLWVFYIVVFCKDCGSCLFIFVHSWPFINLKGNQRWIFILGWMFCNAGCCVWNSK